MKKESEKPQAEEPENGVRQQRLPLQWDTTEDRFPKISVRQEISDAAKNDRETILSEQRDATPPAENAEPGNTRPEREHNHVEHGTQEPHADTTNETKAATDATRSPEVSQSRPDTNINQKSADHDAIRVRLPSTDVSLGQSLLEGRGACNLSISQVAQRTKIPPTFIDAVEADKIEDLPPAVYARSYISQLCRLYGMDPAPLLEEYNRLSGAETRGGKTMTTKRFVLSEDSDAGHLRYGPGAYQTTDARRLTDRLSQAAVISALALLVFLVLLAFGVQQYKNFQMRQAEKTIREHAPATPADADTQLEEFIVPQQLPMRELEIPGSSAERSE